jgi:phage terminase large subunit GpA-like protein
MHFSRKCDEAYFKELTAEKQVTKFSKGFPTKVWMKVRPRNEALDCEVYALAAFTLLSVNMNQYARGFQRRIERHQQMSTSVATSAGSDATQAPAGTPDGQARPMIRKVSRSHRYLRW